MEDRYLFKAKRLDNGEWVQGVPFKVEGKWVLLINDNENLLRVHFIEENMWTAEIYAIEVDASTICRCSGREDKNGNLIWENDIVKVKYSDEFEEITQVIYTEHGYSPYSNEYECEGCCCRCEVLEVEAVGNIFDNKELLGSEG